MRRPQHPRTTRTLLPASLGSLLPWVSFRLFLTRSQIGALCGEGGSITLLPRALPLPPSQSPLRACCPRHPSSPGASPPGVSWAASPAPSPPHPTCVLLSLQFILLSETLPCSLSEQKPQGGGALALRPSSGLRTVRGEEQAVILAVERMTNVLLLSMQVVNGRADKAPFVWLPTLPLPAPAVLAESVIYLCPVCLCYLQIFVLFFVE